MNNISSKDSINITKENHLKAEGKCREARKLVKQSAELNAPDLMYKAIETYTEAIAIYPRLIEPYLSIAYISLQYNQKNNAIMLVNKALEMDPSNKKAKNLLEKARSFKIEKRDSLIEFEKLPEKSKFQKVQKLAATQEIKMSELRAVIKEDNFNILKDLNVTTSDLTLQAEAPVEKIFTKEQLTKDKIEQLEKLKNTMHPEVKIKVNMNSPFMQMFKK